MSAMPAATSLHLTHCHALWAWQELAHGAAYTVLHEHSHCVTEEIDWVRTCGAGNRSVPSVDFELRFLAGLAAAAGLGLVQTTLTPIAGDSSAYLVCWERRE